MYKRKFMNTDEEVYLDNFLACTSYEVDQFQDACTRFSKGGLRFLHLNINGCRTNFDELNVFLSSLPISYAVIALTETHLSPINDVNFELANYKSVSHHSKHGLKIFYAKHLNVNIIPSLTFNDDCKETLFLKIKCKYLGYITFGVLYRPHSATIEQFNHSFSEDILSKFSPLDPIVLTGDFNINLAHASIANDVQDFINLMHESNLLPSIDKVTRYNSLNPSNSSIIDHFWSRLSVPYSTHIIKTNISDHYVIALNTNISLGSETVSIKFRDFSLDNKMALCNDLPDMIEQLNLQLINPNDCTPFFLNWLTNIFNRYFPIKTKQLSLKRLKAPWMTDALLACIKKKHKYFSMVKRGLLSRQFYNKYKNLLTLVIRKSKQRYIHNSFVRTEGNTSKMWKIINDLMSKSKSSLPVSMRNDNNCIVNEPKQVANTLNKFFINCSQFLRSNFPNRPIGRSFNNFPVNERSILLAPTVAGEVYSTINSFANKNNSLNDFPFRILKLISPYISPILADIFNLMVTTGFYPDCLKSAYVTPLFKAGDPLEPLNYRPISVLNSVNKIFERLLLYRLDDFARISNIKTETQFGFTANCGVTDAVINLLGFIRNSVQSKHHCIAVFCDFSKAFDTIDHDRLLMKLSRYGVRGVALNLIKSYPSGRSQSVIINGTPSDPLHISHGVPQGSILGPWLFNIYVNDLAHYLSHPAPVQYADDTTLMAKNLNFDALFNQVQSVLNLFYEWSLANYLSLNSSKTKYMLFSNSNFCGPHLPLFINDAFLSAAVNIFKFLGIHIDYKLYNFKEHIRFVRLKLLRVFGVLYVIGPSMSMTAGKSYYFALVNSLLMYGLIFWGSSYRSNLAPLQILQNKILRNLFADKVNFVSTNDLY